jgi:hypothetical protein
LRTSSVEIRKPKFIGQYSSTPDKMYNSDLKSEPFDSPYDHVQPATTAMDIGDNEYGIDGYRTVIHNRYYIISGRKYWLEISFTPSKLAFIILRRLHNDRRNYLAAILPLHIAKRLLAEDNNEPEAFVKRIKV